MAKRKGLPRLKVPKTSPVKRVRLKHKKDGRIKRMVKAGLVFKGKKTRKGGHNQKRLRKGPLTRRNVKSTLG